MSAQTQAATLLVLTSESSEAERITNNLREVGVTARAVVSAQAERLAELVEQSRCDLVLCCGYDREVDLDAALIAHQRLRLDLPLIVLSAPDAPASERIRIWRSGARDLVLRDDLDHLQRVLLRELSDLAERREVQRLMSRLKDCEQRGRDFIDHTIEAVAFVQEGLHLYANAAYLELFGYTSLDQLETTTFLDRILPEQRARARDYLREVEFSDQQDAPALDTQCLGANEHPFPARVSAASAEFEGEPCLRIIVRAPSAKGVVDNDTKAPLALPEGTGRAAILARIDPLLDRERLVIKPFALLFVRLRSSTELLRDLGLIAGLDQLDEFQGTLSRLIPEQGFLARLSDDSFGILVEGSDWDGAEQLAERIRREARLARRAGSDDDAREPDCDVTFTLVEGRAPEPADLLNQVFQRCLRLREALQGPSGMQKPTSLAARAKQPAAEGDAEIAERIRQALEHDQLRLVYQPIISLMGDNQEHYSVLVRLFDDEEDLLEAKDFIGPAIRHGLIEQVDKWAIRHAIQVIGEQRRAGHSISFFINLSEDTFRNPSIVLWICDAMREFDVRGSWLTFQFQEELVANNLASLSKLVDALKKIKCRVAVNRFGVTDRPQMLLQGLSLDFVLFMPHYAQGLADDPVKQKQVVELASLAREYNVKSVVTGVEDARTLTVLWTAGVDYVQGNFLQRPSPTLEVQGA